MMRGLLPIALLLAGSDASAGAWTRSYGSHYAKLGLDAYTAATYVQPGFETPEGQSFRSLQESVYVEVGLLKSHPLQLVLAAPVVHNTLFLADPDPDVPAAERPRASTTRSGDLRASVQTALAKNGLPLAAALTVKVPAYRNGEIGEAFGMLSEVFPRIGDGQVDLDAWLLAGGSMGKLWTDGGLGYRHRTERFIGWNPGPIAFSDGIAFYDTTGITVEPVIAMVRVEGIVNFRRDETTRQNLSAGPVVLVDIAKGVAIEGRYAVDLWARNATRGMGGGVGLSWRR